MKRNLLLSFIILISLTFLNTFFGQVNQDWKWSHQTPQGNTLRFVKVITATNWVAAGYAGTFMYTTNSGTNWTVYTNAGGTQTGGQGKILYTGWFFNATTGLVAGSSGWMARTTNGGLNWDSLPIPTTSTLYGLHFINSTTGFCGGTSGACFKTTNAGVIWTALTTGVTNSFYNIFAVDANNIFAPSTSGNVIRTTNGGLNWITNNIGATSTLYDIHFINANTGLVCGSSTALYFTTNGGVNWTVKNTGLPSSTFYEIISSSSATTPFTQNFDATTFPPTGWRAVNVAGPIVWVRSTAQYHSSPASAFINYDCSGYSVDWLITPQLPVYSGDSLVFWMRRYDPGYPDTLRIKVSTTDTAMSSFTNNILTIMNNNGYPAANTWGRIAVNLNTFAGQNIYIAFVHYDNCGEGIYLDDVQVGTGGTLSTFHVAGNANYIFRTNTYGNKWDSLSFNAPAQIYTSTYYALSQLNNTIALTGAFGLINATSNNGTNWLNFNQFTHASTLNDIWAENMNGKVWAVGSSGAYSPIMYSTNGGILWNNNAQGVGITYTLYGISMVNTTTGYICGSSGKVYKTINGGTNWTEQTTPGTSSAYRIDFVDANTGWVWGSGGFIWKTTNGGTNWAAQTSGTTSTLYWGDAVTSSIAYACGSSGNLRKTTDGGTTWTALTWGATTTLYSVKMIDANSGYIAGSSGNVRKTTNGGANWDVVTTPYSTTLNTIDFKDMNAGFIGGSSGYTARTTNGGATWTILNTSGSTMNRIFMNHQDSAWAVGSSGYIFKYGKGIVGVTEWNSEIPTTYYLNQNYPNPFNPSTTIKFGIPKSGNVSLRVYDVTGRVAADILNNAPLNAGNVTANFDASNFASGVYFYTLTVDNVRIDSKKMIIVK